jgi:hypothetical protein
MIPYYLGTTMATTFGLAMSDIIGDTPSITFTNSRRHLLAEPAVNDTRGAPDLPFTTAPVSLTSTRGPARSLAAGAKYARASMKVTQRKVGR